MTIVSRCLWPMAALLLACAVQPAWAGHKCHADPLRNLRSGQSYTINVTVKKDEVCSYRFFSGGTMHGVRVVQKPRAAKVIVNDYSLAYAFNQLGSHQMKIEMYFRRGPVTITMLVRVLPDEF